MGKISEQTSHDAVYEPRAEDVEFTNEARVKQLEAELKYSREQQEKLIQELKQAIQRVNDARVIIKTLAGML